jgi:imidazolonepropionase-like amidohydrolase
MQTAFVSGLLIDGTGRPPLREAVVLTENGRITRVASMKEVGEEAKGWQNTVDCAGKILIPGLMDAHVHLTFSGEQDVRQTRRTLETETPEALAIRVLTNAQQALRVGITTLRDCGGRGLTTLRVRDAIYAGLAVGPCILSSAMPITPTAGHLHWCGLRADGEDGVRRATREMVQAGTDFIKMMATGGYMTPGSNPRMCQYTLKEMAIIVEEAHRLGRHVAAHVLAAEGVRRTLEAGVDTLEHCMWHKPDQGDDYDPRQVERIAALGRHVTLARGVARMDDEAPLDELRESFAPWRDMVARGVKLVLATDAGIPSAPRFDLLPLVAISAVSLLDMTPMQAIMACTRVPAEAMWLGQECGTLEPGKRADIVLLDANPLEDIRHLRAVHSVFLAGNRVA